jgi:hypothetical protein
MKKSKAKPISLLELTVRLVSEGGACLALFAAFKESTVDEHRKAYEEAFLKLGPRILELMGAIAAHEVKTDLDHLELRMATLRYIQAFERDRLADKQT